MASTQPQTFMHILTETSGSQWQCSEEVAFDQEKWSIYSVNNLYRRMDLETIIYFLMLLIN